MIVSVHCEKPEKQRLSDYDKFLPEHLYEPDDERFLQQSVRLSMPFPDMEKS